MQCSYCQGKEFIICRYIYIWSTSDIRESIICCHYIMTIMCEKSCQRRKTKDLRSHKNYSMVEMVINEKNVIER